MGVASPFGLAMTATAATLPGNDATSLLRIAKYISPHLISVTERISINSCDISEQDFNALWQELYGGSYDSNAYHSEITSPQARLYGQSLTEFEKLTLLAFEWFKRMEVDLAIIEVGLGGRLDATNIISAEHCLATAITNIGLDHQEYLGNTLEEIAREKRGILKARVPHFEGMLTAAQPNSEAGSNYLLARQIYLHILPSLQKMGCHPEFNKRHPERSEGSPYFGQRREIASPATQARNDDYDEVAKLFHARYHARFDETIPGMLIDGAHNPAGAAELNRYLKDSHAGKNKTWIIGILDKDYKTYLDNLFDGVISKNDRVICTRVNNQRSTPTTKLEEYILTIYPELKLSKQESLQAALNEARRHDGLIVVTGSLYLCGEILRHCKP